MRVRNPWFQSTSFIAALLMLGFTAGSILGYSRQGAGVGLLSTAIFAGFFFLLALSLFWLSLQLGDTERRHRELRKKQRAEETRRA